MIRICPEVLLKVNAKFICFCWSYIVLLESKEGSGIR